jgi:hypothetical protein
MDADYARNLGELTFLTRQGCSNSGTMRRHVDDALERLGLGHDYKTVDIGALPSADPRTGYPTPTLLYKGKDLFGLPSPTPPYPEPS